jgi:hypothetical protein
VEDANLSSLDSLRATLERIPNGTDSVRLMAKLGLWSSDAHRGAQARPSFPKEFSSLSAQQLSDLSARVISDAGRVIELTGLLLGLEMQLKVRLRSARAAARARNRREWPEGAKAPTKTELDDLAEEDPIVLSLEEQLALLTQLRAQADAVKEANQLYKEGVSREITYRAAQLQARVF